MKNTKKVLSVLLAALMLFCLGSAAFAAEKTYVISNPYENIDFSTVNAYKTALHSHTNASDGDPTLKESIERHAQTGFDIVSISDHGTVNYTWATENPNKLIHGALSLVGKSEGDLEYLGSEGTFSDGTAYTYGTAANGDDYLTLSNGKTMMRMPFAIENNAVSVNAHINSWFADYSDNTVTIYEDAVRGIEKAGGVCVINHPGEYTKARYELHTEDAYNEANPAYAYYINKYATLIEKYDSCIGIDMNSKGDNRTRFDRKLWDVLLTRFAANGENVYGVASSDAHQLSVIDTGYTYLLMPELSSAAARTALENGEFFAGSHCLGNYEELVDIAAALKEYYGETELYNKVNGAAEDMAARVNDIENGEMDADEDISITYSVLDDNGFCTAATQPEITDIKVDNENASIEIDSENALIVRFISDGKLIATMKADEAVFDLDDYADELGNYVRAEVFGEGGILYTQAFLINAEENAGSGKVVKGIYFNLGFLDFLFAEFNNWLAILTRFFTNLLPKC